MTSAGHLHAHDEGDRADLHVEIGHRLAGSGQRYSPVRRKLVDALALADRPQSVADLVAALPELAVSSAYRNLGVLAEAGAVLTDAQGACAFANAGSATITGMDPRQLLAHVGR